MTMKYAEKLKETLCEGDYVLIRTAKTNEGVIKYEKFKVIKKYPYIFRAERNGHKIYFRYGDIVEIKKK